MPRPGVAADADPEVKWPSCDDGAWRRVRYLQEASGSMEGSVRLRHWDTGGPAGGVG